MGRKCKIPKKIVVPTEPMVEEPLKIYHTPEAVGQETESRI